ncbi:MAG: hypothetical protein LBC02_14165 [Planctomycetaceae bacterium]|nr:hypothetical protein [Planctomycetaceae bacterium]
MKRYFSYALKGRRILDKRLIILCGVNAKSGASSLAALSGLCYYYLLHAPLGRAII